MERLFWPDLFIIGGGISKKHEKFIPLLSLRTEVLPAQLKNNAGIIGAALFGRTDRQRAKKKPAPQVLPT
jgi:polyphosphate glucokinase